MELLKIALSKGRILSETLSLFNKIQMDFSEVYEDSRKLFFDFKEHGTRVILAKPSDVPTYVEYGVADIGVAGKDVLLEDKKDVFELMDLKLANCKMVVAIPKDRSNDSPIYRVATKYPQIAEEHFIKKGIPVEIIKLHGSVELGPILGLSDAIVDIVSTGSTLKKNNLKIMEEICPISSRLIANPVSFRVKSHVIMDLMEKLEAVL
ncbi:MAG TPA: ATP phosphoribosyltransferase [Thermoanaerobacterales bacterium]|uniref:ATP phosphoribosyltransferase n=1 Tax=Tepidanaerobacter sp. GT38 TaxID=2722793 RepID=UPI00185C5091|nr:ATP phosphoribosyltransferase [Tepidanaerobacter sp. GT38]HHY42899.1 ATP phosphoribosyltransferase [Thermoanaerobacterales bacterium]